MSELAENPKQKNFFTFSGQTGAKLPTLKPGMTEDEYQAELARLNAGGSAQEFGISFEDGSVEAARGRVKVQAGRDPLAECVQRGIGRIPALITDLIDLDKPGGYRIQIFVDYPEYEKQCGACSDFPEDEDVAGLTSAEHKVIGILRKGAYKAANGAIIEGLLLRQVGHAIDDTVGQQLVERNPAARELKWPDGAPRQALESSLDKEFLTTVQQCEKAMAPGIFGKLRAGALGPYLKKNQYGEIFAETFALSLNQGSDPAADPLLVRYYQAAIELWTRRLGA